MKVKQVDMGGDLLPSWRHWCAGRRSNHVIYTDERAQPNGHKWTFNGDVEAPSFSPSVNIVGRCHYTITNGNIMYYNDSAHELAGKTLPLEDLKTLGEDW